MSALKKVHTELLNRKNCDPERIIACWKEIVACHSEKHRSYHNLTHLEQLAGFITPVADRLENFDVVLFSLFYHDSIYNPKRSDNEEKSAELAQMRMTELGIDQTDIERCMTMILATKSHHLNACSDINYFTDADLAILGQPLPEYLIYTKQIRQEYNMYPGILYKPGRRKVLSHFLNMERIFKTDYFFEKFELQARTNLREEIKLL